jgi:glycosyltransferase involved in cell wall biosynthesis/2-polyprenyl-3-methyl-5-hydroxy-6-metoxy-1,4-benzoquinol methylase
MKIAIDISLTGGESAGVGSYTRGLLEGLAAIDEENEYVLYSYVDLQPPDPALPHRPNFSLRRLSLEEDHWERIWSRAELPPKETLEAVNIIHSPFFNAPKEHYGALVVTIYDLSFLLQPQFHTEANRLHCLQGTLNAALYADRIITISLHSKKDLVEYFSIPEDRIRVIYPAPRKVYYPERNIDVIRATLERLEIYHNFILFVGSLEPRKNLKSLLQAYAMYVKRHSGRELLVVAGAKGWLNQDISQVVADLGLEERVKFLGYVQESDLRALYSVAKVFVYPSIYEGFGLPPLEAMACGAPVITSNTSALPEVVGDAAILIDPYDSEKLCQAMRAVLCDAEGRSKMRQQSLERAKLFTWERTAQETLVLYQEVYWEHHPEERISAMVSKIQKSWDWFAREDPLWATLTQPDKKDGGWSEHEFLEEGRRDIRYALEKIDAMGLRLHYGKALDFGCGPGRLTQALAEHFQEVHGVDIAPSMIAKAKELNRHGARCIYHLNEAHHLRLFDDNTFDLVFSALVLQHMPRPLAFGCIMEFVRVTKPGGLMMFQVPDHRRATDLTAEQKDGGVPEGFWRGKEPMMIMSGMPFPKVVEALEASGARLLEAVHDESAGPEWVSYLYIAMKLPAAAHEDQP